MSKRSFLVIIALLPWILVLGSAPAAPEEQFPGPADPVELGAFLDGLVTTHLQVHHAAGATVSVVKDGAIFLTRGYGYADVDSKKRVDPSRTLFRVGSVSKLFVWTAVMQLVERGLLDLHADVNTYLKDLRIPATYPEPITMAHLMTHTAGFEDRVLGLFGRTERSLAPLGQILRRELPLRVRPAGEFSSYSNHGTGLAMYVVESVTGVPWEQYIQANILEPLEMTHTTFRQPIPEPLATDMSMGYRSDGGRLEKEDFEYVPLAPVGACSSTAEDMAKFMIAHLQWGAYGSQRILAEATARRMQSELFRHAPGVSPMDHGFIEIDVNGERLVGHGGDTLWFHTMWVLLPEHHLGVFVSYNTDTGEEATDPFIEQFMDRYFPAEEVSASQPPSDFAERASRFVGNYRPNRYSHSTIAKLAAIQAIEVEDSGDGALMVEDKRFVEVAPLTFRREDGKKTIVFRESPSREMTHVFFSDLPFIAFDKLGITERPVSQAVLAASLVLLFLVTVVVWPLAAGIRRHYRITLSADARLPTGAKTWAWMASLLFVVFPALLALLLARPEEVVFGAQPSLLVTLAIPIVAILPALVSLGFAWKIWRRGEGRMSSRVFYTILVLGFIIFLAELHYWNLLGFRV